MDGETTPAKSPLEERVVKAAERQYRAAKMIEMAGMPTGADFMGIVARQRVLKELLVQAGLVRDQDGVIPETREAALKLFKVLEEEAKAQVLEDILDVASGRPNERAAPVVRAAATITKGEQKG